MRYVISVDIDDGLNIKNLLVEDALPPSVTVTNVSVASPANAANTITPPPPFLDVQFTDPAGITGVVNGTVPEVVIYVDFYVGSVDTSGSPVLPADCSFSSAPNDVWAIGDWDPNDPRDTPQPVQADGNALGLLPDYTFTPKCLALQKTSFPADPLTVIPGDPITSTLDFQVSDYLQMGHLVVTDKLSDGQTFDPTSVTLTVTDKTGGVIAANPALSPYVTTVHACDSNTPWPFPPLLPGGPPQIGTTITFNVSNAIANLYVPPSVGPPSQGLPLGFMTGGAISLFAFPNTTPGATGTITFQTTVDDVFSCPVPSGDASVDKFDRLYNYATITGEVIDRSDQTYAPTTASDDPSGVMVPVEGDTVKKCIYSVERGGSFVIGPPTNSDCAVQPNATSPQITPGDRVTFRILKRIPAGDYEHIDIKDFLPLPVLQPYPSSQPAFSYAPGPAINPPCVSPIPVPTAPGTDNSITFAYAPADDPLNNPCDIDILLGVTVTGDPYADGLLFTNEVQECEKNSFNETICQTAIAPMELTEPRLRITKGVVAACQPDPLDPQYTCLKPALGPFAGPVAFNNGGSNPPWGSSPSPYTPPITSAGLASNPINSNANLDAGDIATFAVVVENYGSGLNGAFDVTINDLPQLPAGFVALPPGTPGYNFSVVDGTGLPLLISGHRTTRVYRRRAHPPRSRLHSSAREGSSWSIRARPPAPWARTT